MDNNNITNKLLCKARLIIAFAKSYMLRISLRIMCNFMQNDTSSRLIQRLYSSLVVTYRKVNTVLFAKGQITKKIIVMYLKLSNTDVGSSHYF